MRQQDILEVPSLISRNASTAIKGLLMLLIVLGHTKMLTTNFSTGEYTFLHDWLYTFHVHVFFILPFIYGYNKNVEDIIGEKDNKKIINLHYVIKDFKHYVIKIGVPYFWFFLFYATIFVIIGGGDLNIGGMIYAFIFGGQNLMSKYIGFNLMWFLPAMLALITLKSIWYNSNDVVKHIMLTISIVLWVLCITRIVEMGAADAYVPFSITQGFYYLILGLATRWLIEKFSINKMIPWIIIGIILLTCLFYFRKDITFNPFWIIRMLMPILVFILLFSMEKILSKSKLLLFLGKYSLQIYLFHVAIINVLNMLLLHFINESFGLGLIIYLLTLIISAVFSLVVVRIPFLNKALFPKG